MEQLKQMKEQLTTTVMSQMNNLENVHTKELGEAIDMIKDLAEAIYYCHISKAMEDSEKQEYSTNNNYYYTERYMPYDVYARDMDRMQGRMYYPSSSGADNSSSSSGVQHYTEKDYPMMRDSREGRSPMRRKMYMESKAIHNDDQAIADLENYMKDLTQDIMEMLNSASPDEKALLQKKVNVLATKLQNV